jgi:hypothetical protein
MLVAVVKPEDISGEMESTDLPAPVGQYFRGTHRSGHDLVNVLDRFAFAKYLGVCTELQRHAQRQSGQYAPVCSLTGA